jgi:DNA-binding transcriptional regulator YhcF (GntR family)
MIINLDYTSRTPIYEQIVNEIERYVALGILKEKQQIMSIRELASNLGINPNTVKKAYSILEQRNIIVSMSTKGTFIKENASLVKENTIDNYINDITEQAGAEMKSAEQELRKEWGKYYAAHINNISAKITQLYPEETVQRMEAAGMFRDANFLKAQLALTKMMTGDTIYIEGRGIENVPQTIEDLRAKRDSLMEVDYVKNKAQVNELNKQIVQLQMAQQGQLGRMRG